MSANAASKPAEATTGMILLSDNNRILEEIVTTQVNWAQEHAENAGDEQEENRGMMVTLCDFDNVSYLVQVREEALNVLSVQMYVPGWEKLGPKGGKKALTEIYGPYVTEPTDGSYNIAIDVDMTSLDTEAKKAELIEKVGKFKVNCIGGFFQYYFDMLAEGKVEAPFKMPFGTDCELFVVPMKDRVIFIYGLRFEDKADQAIAKVMMKEFEAAKKVAARAPPCSFTHGQEKPPRELQDHFKIMEPTGNLGYVSFAILKDHISDKKRRALAASMLQSFRTYIQYHLKCSKSYFHSRMRKRVKDLLKILSRAKQSAEEAVESKRNVIKRTAAGKVFKGPGQP